MVRRLGGDRCAIAAEDHPAARGYKHQCHRVSGVGERDGRESSLRRRGENTRAAVYIVDDAFDLAVRSICERECLRSAC